MLMIDTDKMREAFRDTNRGKTHREGCEYDHPLCAIAALCDELDAIRQESRWRLERMEFETSEHAKTRVENADLRRQCEELRKEIPKRIRAARREWASHGNEMAQALAADNAAHEKQIGELERENESLREEAQMLREKTGAVPDPS